MATAAIEIPEAFADLFTATRHKAFFGGRGGAKSHSFAAALLVQASESPLRILCAREIQISIRDSVKRLLDDKIAALGLGGFFESTQAEIRGANGSLIVFAGLRTDPEKIKSMEGIDRAWVEEANTVSQRSIDLLIPTVRKPGSEIWWTWNPRRPDDPVDAMFRGKDGPPPGSTVKEVSWRDNPWFTDELAGEMEWDLRRDPDKHAHIWGGSYVLRSEARVFKNWRVGSHDEFETPEGTRYYYGADWGFASDPTALVRCWIEGRTIKVDHAVRAVGCEIDHTPALFDRVPGSRLWPIVADSARPETISWMQRNGFPAMRAARKGPGSVEEGIAFLQSYDIVVHPRCQHLIDELTLYAYKVDQHTGEVLPILEDRENHMTDSLRYALEGLRSAVRWIPAPGAAPALKPTAEEIAAKHEAGEPPKVVTFGGEGKRPGRPPVTLPEPPGGGFGALPPEKPELVDNFIPMGGRP